MRLITCASVSIRDVIDSRLSMKMGAYTSLCFEIALMMSMPALILAAVFRFVE